MRHTIDRILRKYGTPILLRRIDGDTTIYGFMQHTGSLGWKNMQPVYSPLGEIPRGQYLLLLPVEPLLERGDIFKKEDDWYVVRRVEKMWHGGEAIYCWCLCEEGGEAGIWGSQF